MIEAADTVLKLLVLLCKAVITLIQLIEFLRHMHRELMNGSDPESSEKEGE